MRIEIPNGEIIDSREMRDDELAPLGMPSYPIARSVVLTVRCYPDENGEMYRVIGTA